MQIKFNWLVVAFLLCRVSLSFAEEKKSAEAHKKSEGHGKGSEAPRVEKKLSAAESFTIDKKYVHMWVKFPDIEATDLSKVPKKIHSQKGYVTLLFFIASWCVPCQNMMKNVQNLRKRYEPLSTRFYFVFAHDLAQDAKNFAQEYKLENTILANHDVLKTFHNPQLPAVYISDRDEWLVDRVLGLTDKSLKELDSTLYMMTAY